MLTVTQGRGAPRQLEVEAADRDAAVAQAKNLGFHVLGGESHGGTWWPSRARTELPDVALFVEQLRDLLQAGLSLIEALEVIARSTPNSTKVRDLRARLLEGQRFSSALETVGQYPAVLIALVRAAELTSQLGHALDRYLDHHKAVAELKHRVQAVAIYPALLLIVGTLVLAFLAFFVMPRFAMVYEGMTTELPWAAKAMVAWASWLKGDGTWWPVAAACGLLVAGGLMYATPARAQLLLAALRLPAIRDLVTAHFLARWYRATGLLLQGGIPLPDSLELTNTLLPAYMQHSGLRVKAAVESGLSPSAAYAANGMATPIAAKLLAGGERSGDLGGVLTRIARFHELEVTRRVERVMRTMEPAIMVLIGVGVGMVVVLMYMPIFELASAVQ